ncbi:hypothetical protein Misp06_00702 [Microbulbifer sp. NBRC 101763]
MRLKKVCPLVLEVLTNFSTCKHAADNYLYTLKQPVH